MRRFSPQSKECAEPSKRRRRQTTMRPVRSDAKKSIAIAMDFFICVRRTQMNDVALRANDVLRNDVMLRINDVALRANGFSPSTLAKHRKCAIIKPERRCYYEKIWYSHYYCYALHLCFIIDRYGYDVYESFRIRSRLWKKTIISFGSFPL